MNDRDRFQCLFTLALNNSLEIFFDIIEALRTQKLTEQVQVVSLQDEDGKKQAFGSRSR